MKMENLPDGQKISRRIFGCRKATIARFILFPERAWSEERATCPVIIMLWCEHPGTAHGNCRERGGPATVGVSSKHIRFHESLMKQLFLASNARGPTTCDRAAKGGTRFSQPAAPQTGSPV